MITGSRSPRLLLGLFSAALAVMIGTAHGVAPAASYGRAMARGSVPLAGLPAARDPELRAAQEHIPKAPPEQAARTRRPASAGAPGILPAPVAAPAMAAVVLVMGSSTELLALPSECSHCTVAPRPPPIS